MKKFNTMTLKKLNEVEIEKESMIAKMSELHGRFLPLSLRIMCLLIRLIH